MTKTSVLVLGGTGMLGSMLVDVFSRDEKLRVIATARTPELAKRAAAHAANIEWRTFTVGPEEAAQRGICELGQVKWIINAIGLTKPYIKDDRADEIEMAISVNSVFPHVLTRTAAQYGASVLQIATDCVYSGLRGEYVEQDLHDPLDVYGKTKSLGEALLPNLHRLRCSIIGPEPKVYTFLLEWFRRQPRGASLNGFTNHLWNGVTTLHFAKLCLGVIKNEIALPLLQHIVPADDITKADLLKCFAQSFGRTDVSIKSVEAPSVVNRTLRTANDPLNLEIWKSAGYGQSPPTVPEMVREVAEFDYRFSEL